MQHLLLSAAPMASLQHLSAAPMAGEGSYSALLVTMAMDHALTSTILPKGLSLAPQNLTATGTHPMVFAFGNQSNVRPILAPIFDAKVEGSRGWALLASHIPGRTGKECQDRWRLLNPPGSSSEESSEEEEEAPPPAQAPTSEPPVPPPAELVAA